MAITNHTAATSIYQMVLNRVPFVVDDDTHNFTVAVNSRIGASITLVGDWTAYLRANVTMSFDTPATAEIQNFSFAIGTGLTTITFIILNPLVLAGATLAIEANYNEVLISTFIYETMVALQNCFLIEPETNVGDEQYYSDLQKMIIADIVAYRIIFSTTVGNSQGNTINTSSQSPTLRYVATAATDGISTSWAYLNIKTTAFLSMDAEKMMQKFQDSATCTAKQLGCNIEVCNGTVSCCGGIPIIEMPFRVAGALSPCRNCAPPRRY